MNLIINRGEIDGEYYHALKSVYYKAGIVDIIGRTDGMTKGGVLVIYELAD